MKKHKQFKIGILKNEQYGLDNRGTTLVELIVSFALMAIFLASSASVIGTITKMYYQITGETYSKQVGDIVMEKVASLIEGAKYEDGEDNTNPKIDDDINKKFGTSITLFDRTDTKLTIKTDSISAVPPTDPNEPVRQELLVEYAEITGSDSIRRNATTWKFDNDMYNGFSIIDFHLIRGDAFAVGEPDASSLTALAGSYGLNGDLTRYGKNVVLVLMTIDNEKYGEYKFYRFVKMYNVTP